MSLYVCAIGLAEILLQRDLLPFPGGGVDLAGDYSGDRAQILIRPNGPFSTDNSFALVSLVNFFLLVLLKQMIGKMAPWQRCLHRLGIATSLLAGFLPLFRSVLISIVVILVVDIWYHHGRARVRRIGAMAVIVVGLLLMRSALPAVFEERSDMWNLYGRIAQQRQTLLIVIDHPMFGVGLNNFRDAVSRSTRYSTSYLEAESQDSPHNTLGAIAAETGLVGLVPFLLAQVLLFWAFLSLPSGRNSTLARGAARQTGLYLLLLYWINGLSLTSGYAAELNIWFALVLSMTYAWAAGGNTVESDRAKTQAFQPS